MNLDHEVYLPTLIKVLALKREALRANSIQIEDVGVLV
tara:strand:- start:1252 stop:1365 length:114 start_codon:yes stop_codon:yes gene_type:complete